MKFKISEPVNSIKAYEPGKPLKEVQREYNIGHPVKLASNENPFGYSPSVREAVGQQLDQMHRYPEPGAYDLVNGLSHKWNVKAGNIVVGNGSDDIIALLCHGFLNAGDEALMPLPSFLMYEISVKTAKGVPVMVPLKDFSTNLDGILKQITGNTRMIFITNPFNPTGSIITHDEFASFSAKVPDDVLIIVDEAYIEFARDKEVFNSLKPPLSDSRIVTLRTFSKAYGLAGFRVGYGIMDKEVAAILQRIRQPFNVNTLAQAAAVAALDDDSFLVRTIQNIQQGIDYLVEELSALGIRCLPTQANFMMIDLEADATAVFKKMLEHGVIVRSMKSYGFDTFLRVNTGTPAENKAFITALKKVLGK